MGIDAYYRRRIQGGVCWLGAVVSRGSENPFSRANLRRETTFITGQGWPYVGISA
jgi:hypothetical protein